jgi:hypothetical protein
MPDESREFSTAQVAQALGMELPTLQQWISRRLVDLPRTGTGRSQKLTFTEAVLLATLIELAGYGLQLRAAASAVSKIPQLLPKLEGLLMIRQRPTAIATSFVSPGDIERAGGLEVVIVERELRELRRRSLLLVNVGEIAAGMRKALAHAEPSEP